MTLSPGMTLSAAAVGRMPTAPREITFAGIAQRRQFPAYITTDPCTILQQIIGRTSYHASCIVFDQDIPWCTGVVDRIMPALPTPTMQYPVRAGEDLKTMHEVTRATDKLSELLTDKPTLMIIIGGGTVCNFAGFVASLWNGMDMIIVPTTYTAICDVAIGSLQMINLPRRKNWLRTAFDPIAVMIDRDCLTDLPVHERRNGLIETIKHALCQDGAMFHEIEQHASVGRIYETETLFALALRTAERKSALLADAPQSDLTTGILKYGHTIAHAIEEVSHYAISHGTAVALGLLVEIAFFCPPTSDLFHRVRALMQQLGYAVTLPLSVTLSQLHAHLHRAPHRVTSLRILCLDEIGKVHIVDDTVLFPVESSNMDRGLRVIDPMP